MLDWTDRHCRYFLRLISKQTLLYTEMVTTGALIHGDRKRYLRFDKAEHPVAIQLGGSDPADLANCSVMCEDEGYDEINLNVGCPSDRVQSGKFGACLMAEPELVRDCIGSMINQVDTPVTVKHRIGIDRDDSLEQLLRFIEIVKQSGCKTFIIHARKAWLDGLSPKQNRDIPPLKYDVVYQVKQLHPELEIIINGGIHNLDDAENHLQAVDGVMLGRAIYHDPWLLADVDRRFYKKDNPLDSPLQVIEQLLPYIQQQMEEGAALKHITRHILGLFQGLPGAKSWRRVLSEKAYLADAGPELLQEAVAKVRL